MVANATLTTPGGLTNYNHTANTYTFDVSLSSLGLNQGDSFNFVGTLISETAYRSNETIGTSVTTPGDGSGNAGFNNPQMFTDFDTYMTTAVPEPSTWLAGGLSFGSLFLVRRRRA